MEVVKCGEDVETGGDDDLVGCELECEEDEDIDFEDEGNGVRAGDAVLALEDFVPLPPPPLL